MDLSGLNVYNKLIQLDYSINNISVRKWFDASFNHMDISGVLNLKNVLQGPSTFYIDPAAYGNNSGKVIINGDLEIQGTTTTINSTIVDISDKTLVLSSNSQTKNQAHNSGLIIQGSSAELLYNYDIVNNSEYWKSNIDINATNFIGSGINLTNVIHELTNYDDASFGNVDICGSLNVNGLLETSGNIFLKNGSIIFEHSDEYIISNDSGIISIINDLSHNLNNLLTSVNDASLNNVDISGVLSGSSGYNNNTLKYSSHLIPTTNDAFDIGSAEYKVRDLYVSDNSIFIGDKNKLAIDENTGSLIIRKRKDNKIPSGLFDNITNQELESIGLVDKNNIELVKQDINQKIGKQINNLSEMKLEDWKIYSDVLNNITGKPIKVMNEIFKPNESDDWEEEKDLNNLLTSKNDASLNNVDISGTIRLPDSSNNGYGASGEVLTSQGNNKPPVWKEVYVEPQTIWNSRPYANFVNFAGVDIELIHGITDLPFDSAVLSKGINLDTGGILFTVDNSAVYICNVSFRGGAGDIWTCMYIRDSNNNIIATSQVIGTTDSIEAGFFVMAPLNSETSYKISIHRQDGPMTLYGSNNIGYQINCIIYTV